MNNIVDFRKSHSRPQRSILVSRGEAQILFFTGVRYFRETEDEVPSSLPGDELLRTVSETAQQFSSEPTFDLAAC